MGKHLQLISTIIPLLIVAIGLVGWVLTLRSDISIAQDDIVEMRREIQLVSQESRQAQIDITKFTNQIDGLIEEVGANSPAIAKIKTDLAIANDQMRTIMSDHSGFGDALKELGKSAVMPSGERRDYGGYGGY